MLKWILALVLALVGFGAMSAPTAKAASPSLMGYPDYSDNCMVCWFNADIPGEPFIRHTTGIGTVPWPGTIFTFLGNTYIVSEVTWDVFGHWDVMCHGIA